MREVLLSSSGSQTRSLPRAVSISTLRSVRIGHHAAPSPTYSPWPPPHINLTIPSPSRHDQVESTHLITSNDMPDMGALVRRRGRRSVPAFGAGTVHASARE